MNLKDIEKIREVNPVVVNCANFVTPFLVANGLNVIGASPIMSTEVEEAEELVKIASAVVINAGAVRQDEQPMIEKMCAMANKYQKPLVLDPVAVGATQYRKQLNLKLLEKYHFDVIRGNVGEIAVLAGVDWQTRGIDAGDGSSNLVEVVKTCAQKFNNVVIASGATDYISDGVRVTKVLNNIKLLPSIVGSGDLLSSMAAAYCAVSKNAYDAAINADLELVCAGEIMTEKLNNQNLPGSFLSGLMDELATITSDKINEVKRVEEDVEI